MASAVSTQAPTPAPGRWARALTGEAEPLRELAESYWYCAYAWWRRAGLDADHACTATVASFTRWLSTKPPSREDSAAPRLRAWLPARLAELAGTGIKLQGPPALNIDPAWAERRYADEPPGDPEATSSGAGL